MRRRHEAARCLPRLCEAAEELWPKPLVGFEGVDYRGAVGARGGRPFGRHGGTDLREASSSRSTLRSARAPMR